jgi:hypothetical protein
MNIEWRPGTVYLKTTDDEGHSTFTVHNCWNADTFVKFCHAAATAAGGKAEEITPDEYKRNK